MVLASLRVALALLLVCGSAQAWSMAGGNPAHTGVGADSDGGTGARLWGKVHEGDFTTWTSSAVDEGILYAVMSRVEPQGNEPPLRGPAALIAMDATSGEELWRHTMPHGVHASPLLLPDAIVLGAVDGALRAVHRSNGTLLWSQQLGGPVLDPIAHDGLVLLSAGVAGVVALDPGDGSLRWHRTVGGAAAPITLLETPEGALLLVPSADGNLTALDPGSGRTVWRTTLGHALLFAPSAADGVAYATDMGGGVHAVDATGAVLWSRSFAPAYAPTPVVQDGRLFVSLVRTGVQALHASTGTTIWSYDDLDASAVPPAASGDLVFASGEQVLSEPNVAPRPRDVVVGLDPDDGRLAWRFREDAGRLAVDGGVLVVSGRLELVAFDVGAGPGAAIAIFQARPLLTEPQFPQAGETFVLPVRVANLGDMPGHANVTVVQDGRQVAREQVHLLMGDSTILRFTLKAKAGTTHIEVLSDRDSAVHERDVLVQGDKEARIPAPLVPMALALGLAALTRRRRG